MTAKRPRIVPAVVRLDAKPAKPTRQAALRQFRQIAAWRKRAKQ